LWHGKSTRRAARAASHIFVNAEDNRALVTDRWGYPSHVMLDTGAPPAPGEPRRYDGNRPLRIVWSGLHVGRKAMPLLLKALARIKSEFPGENRFELKVLGGGPQTEAWQSLAREFGLESCTRWTGQISRDKALAEMRDADVFAFTSLQEGTSSVVMEALALGLPVICHDACGMGVAVNESCGIKVPLQTPAVSIEGFARAIGSLIRDPQRLERLSAGALARADQLSWDRKVDQIAAVYEDVLTATPRPH